MSICDANFELSTLLRLEWSPLISFIEDINDQKSNFVEKKKDLSPYKIFLWKEGRSFQKLSEVPILLYIPDSGLNYCARFSRH